MSVASSDGTRASAPYRTVDLRRRLTEFPDEVDVVGFVFEQHGVHGIG